MEFKKEEVINSYDKLNLSASCLSCWEECRRKFLFKHILRLPEDSDMKHAIVGNIVHKTMEWFSFVGNNYPEEVLEDEVSKYFLSMWKSEEILHPEINELEKDSFRKMSVRGAKIQKRTPLIMTEKLFMIPIHVEGVQRKVNFKGYMDGIIVENGENKFIDWKTGRSHSKYANQLRLYALASTMTEDIPTMKKGKLLFLKNGSTEEYTFNETQLNQEKERLFRLAKEIFDSKKEFDKPVEETKKFFCKGECQFCGFKKICEEFDGN